MPPTPTCLESFMTENYLLKFRIRSIEQRERIASGRKLPDGSSEFTHESQGYVLTLDPGGLSLFLGHASPSAEWKKGADVLMTLTVK